MREELKTHKLLLSFVMLWLIIFLTVVLLLGRHHSESRVEAVVVLILLLVVASALAYVGLSAIVAAFDLGSKHRREFGTYVTLGLLGLALATVLALTTRESMASIGVTVAPFPLLFGLAELRLAFGFGHHHRQARRLAFCGTLEIAAGVLLALSHSLREVFVLETLCLTALVTLLQLIVVLAFGPHEFQHS